MGSSVLQWDVQTRGVHRLEWVNSRPNLELELKWFDPMDPEPNGPRTKFAIGWNWANTMGSRVGKLSSLIKLTKK